MLTRRETSDAPVSSPFPWETWYQNNDMPWDLAGPAPPLVTWLEHSKALLGHETNRKLLVPGAGIGHDAALFARHGFQVTGLDLSPTAVAQATARHASVPNLRFLQADLFQLPETMSQSFDGWIEHTCFCAIPPSLRVEYAASAARLLKPGAWLLGLFWAHARKGGPPFGTSQDELERLFEPYFTFKQISKPIDSTPSCQGEELLCLLERKRSGLITHMC